MADEPKAEDPQATKDETKTKGVFPKRYVLIIMIFLGFAVQYALRVNLNVAITAMCNNHTTMEKGFTITKVSSLKGVYFFLECRSLIKKVLNSSIVVQYNSIVV